ncbi:MAG TPA: hypothetical protein VIY48_19265 [Candidatus Paceibacterota bacterium]
MSTYVKDLAERVIATGALAFLSSFSFSDLSTAHDAAIAAGSAVSALVVGLLARFVGNPDSAGISK